MEYLKNVNHLHRCLLFLRNSYSHFQLRKACLFMDHVINEMEKNVQESLLLSEIIFTSILPLAITVSSPKFRNSEFFLHQIKSKNNKSKTEQQIQGEEISYHYGIILLLFYLSWVSCATLQQLNLFLIIRLFLKIINRVSDDYGNSLYCLFPQTEYVKTNFEKL